MLTGKQKLYFLLDAIDDARVLTPAGHPLIIDPTNDLNRKYRDVELVQLFTKLEKDERILEILKVPSRIKEIDAIENLDPYDHADDGCWHIKLLPALDDYFLKIQQESEYQEYTGKTPAKSQPKSVLDLSTLHAEIYSKCQSLFEKGEYAEAAEKGFKVVRDRLRVLTNYETGAKAFGNTKLHIKGAVAPNVDYDFNEAVKFLTMAIDNFRNEKSHTSNAKIDDPQRAYEYLTLSSLAMNLLDQAEIKP
jgi:uncharacterized protein (TIGR02391 family)